MTLENTEYDKTIGGLWNLELVDIMVRLLGISAETVRNSEVEAISSSEQGEVNENPS